MSFKNHRSKTITNYVHGKFTKSNKNNNSIQNNYDSVVLCVIIYLFVYGIPI